jgi:lantibiotic modifying enzyme
MTGTAEDLAVGALDWLLARSVDVDGGVGWSAAEGDSEIDLTVYSGTAGIAVTFLEAYRHFGDEKFARTAQRAGRALAAGIGRNDDSSLYGGVAGIAWALHTMGQQFDDAELTAAARRGLALVRDRFDGERWSINFELLLGNAGIGLAALAVGDIDLAVLAVSPYLKAAERTKHGVQWETRTDTPPRLHHVSHGTLGVALALLRVGVAADRPDFMDLALTAVADVLSRNEDGEDGFLVPHSDPQLYPDLISRFNYGWCHGPTGDAQVFRLLQRLTGERAWRQLVDRCWHTVRRSGVPQRLSPGFWDNSGHCCGTASVLAFACDRTLEAADGDEFGQTLVADLADRASHNAAGVTWPNHEHRTTPSRLPAQTGWAMGNAGIITELLRYARIEQRRDPEYAITWPDACPAAT